MVEEDRRAAALAASDATCFADRRGGEVWLAAAQLDSAPAPRCSSCALRSADDDDSSRDSSCCERPLPLSRPLLQVRVRARRPASAAAATMTTTAEVSVGVGVCVRVLLARARGRRRPELTGFCVSELLRV